MNIQTIILFIFTISYSFASDSWIEKDLIQKLEISNTDISNIAIIAKSEFGEDNVDVKLDRSYIGIKAEQKLKSHDGNKTYHTSIDIKVTDNKTFATYTLWPISDEEYSTNNGKFTLVKSEIIELQTEWKTWNKKFSK